MSNLMIFAALQLFLNQAIAFSLSTTSHTKATPSSGHVIRNPLPTSLKSISDSVREQDKTIDESTSFVSSAGRSSFDDFDYTAHWYPVIWAVDLILNEPTKVTVFDVDYVVAKTSDTQVSCLQDRCPHKAAALSQGRVTATGKFQCAYHGWSFDGETGDCVDIPQIASERNLKAEQKIPSRSCAQAVPAQIFQEMVWIFPGGSWEDALQAPPPPSVPEYEKLGFKLSSAVREMPVDWPILLSNICDPDHGLFAHQNKAFDMYSGSTEFPLDVTEDFPNDGKGYVLKSRVDARNKILKVDETWRESSKTKKRNKGKDEETPWATTTLVFPNHVQLKRVQKDDNLSKAVTAFYICPTGVGRSRFMSAAISKRAVPRWAVKLLLDNFLDQDTYLLATQQQYILSQEAEDLQELMKEPSFDPTVAKMKTRKNMFCLCSPTERFGAKIEHFWDSTLLRSPNRIPRLLQLQSAGAFSSTPSREFVLDRKTQQLDIVPNSQDVVRNCRRISVGSKALLVGAVAAKFVLGNGKRFAGGNVLFSVACGASLLASWIADKVEREYYFKYTDEMRRKDLRTIPEDIWADK